METIFDGEYFYGVEKQNMIAKEQFLKANPGISSVIYMHSSMPEKPYFFGLTELGYFEGNFQIGAIAGLKNFQRAHSIPYSAIKEVILNDGELLFRVDPAVPGTFVSNQNGGRELGIAQTAVTDDKSQFIIDRILETQQSRRIKPADLTLNGVSMSQHAEEMAPISAVTDQAPEKPQHSAGSIGNTADELTKAKNLLDLGAISEDEFALLKKKILGF